jgi:putative hydrolase of HD superfamily
MQSIDQEITFISESDKLKNIVRKTRNFSNKRFENDAEHSWHICLMAITLQKYANKPVDLARVLQMLIIHDLGEIYNGDIMVYLKTEDHKQAELEAANRLLSLLGPVQQEQLYALLVEFETRASDEARYAHAIDRAEPILQNLHHNGETWRVRGITYEQIIAVNEEKISQGSETLWRYLRPRIDRLKTEGIIA